MTDTDKTQGFLAGLTNEQRTAALAYSGDDLHGPADTDKLKRLAEDWRHSGEYMLVEKYTILALIAENERLKGESDEAVALLRETDEFTPFDLCGRVDAFLARIDAAE